MTMKQINSWSFTKVLDFERCAFYAYLKYACHIKEPEAPLRPGQTEQANLRGSRIHNAGEQYVRGSVKELDPGLRAFAPEFKHARAMFTTGKIALEEEWGFDRDWNKTDYKSAWHRAKLDMRYMLNPVAAVCVDYKTGRKDGNEAKHGQQGQLYAVDIAMLEPQVEEVTVEMWYLDKDDIKVVTYPRPVVLAFKKAWQNRGNAVVNAKDFPPNPNKFVCKYCQYGPWNGGQCQSGVRG